MYCGIVKQSMVKRLLVYEKNLKFNVCPIAHCIIKRGLVCSIIEINPNRGFLSGEDGKSVNMFMLLWFCLTTLAD